MTTGFGRKGVTGGAAYAPTIGSTMGGMARAAYPEAGTISDDAELTRTRQDFLAAERARTGGLSAVAADFSYDRGKPTRSMGIAYLLWFFVGLFAGHRFYLGAYRSAFAQVGIWMGAMISISMGVPQAIAGLFVLGAFIWILADVILIPGLHRECRA